MARLSGVLGRVSCNTGVTARHPAPAFSSLFTAPSIRPHTACTRTLLITHDRPPLACNHRTVSARRCTLLWGAASSEYTLALRTRTAELTHAHSSSLHTHFLSRHSFAKRPKQAPHRLCAQAKWSRWNSAVSAQGSRLHSPVGSGRSGAGAGAGRLATSGAAAAAGCRRRRACRAAARPLCLRPAHKELSTGPLGGQGRTRKAPAGSNVPIQGVQHLAVRLLASTRSTNLYGLGLHVGCSRRLHRGAGAVQALRRTHLALDAVGKFIARSFNPSSVRRSLFKLTVAAVSSQCCPWCEKSTTAGHLALARHHLNPAY